MKHYLRAARLIFGAWMLASGLGHFMGTYALPTGTEPHAVQLMHALVHIGLLDVAMAIQAAAGAFLLAGVFVPAALCVQMPISVCAAYWAVVLERDPLWGGLALAAVALGGLLMLAHLDYYRGVLERHPLAVGETTGSASYEGLFANPAGRTARAPFIGALATLVTALAFYWLWVPGPTGQFALLAMLYPGMVLLAQRLHDMGRSGWPVLLPGALLAFAGWLQLYVPEGEAARPAAWAVAIVAAGFIAWCLTGNGRTDAPA